MDTQTFQKQYPLALIALGEHINTHQLPAPLDIFVLDHFDDGHMVKAIRLHLPGQHTHKAWVDSVVVDAKVDEPAASGHGVRTQWSVRLPDTEFRFEIVGYHHALMSVPA